MSRLDVAKRVVLRLARVPLASDLMPRSLFFPVVISEEAVLELYYPWHLAYMPPHTQGYSSRHPAHDWALPNWTPYYAPLAGTFRRGYGTGYANYLTITGTSHMALLAHLPNGGYAAGLCDGCHVAAGQLVGYSDNTGYSTGPHCHMEVRRSPYRYGTNNIDFYGSLRTWTGTPPQPEPPDVPPFQPGDAVNILSGWNMRDAPSGKVVGVSRATIPAQVITVQGSWANLSTSVWVSVQGIRKK